MLRASIIQHAASAPLFFLLRPFSLHATIFPWCARSFIVRRLNCRPKSRPLKEVGPTLSPTERV
jgi:hypothetical protein